MRTLTHAAFAAALALALAAPELTVAAGPFTWWPLFRLHLSGNAYQPMGILLVLPLAALVGWLALHLRGQASRFAFGSPWITLPFLLLTLLILARLPSASITATFITARLGLFWFVYLFALNERPSLWLPLSLACAVQGAVSMGQFFSQGDLGLRWLGEWTLDPQRSGVIVALAGGERWLRGYGLTGNPNQAGALLSIGILLLAPALAASSGWRRALILAACSLALGGLMASFSRSAWLALLCGGLVWGVGGLRIADCGLRNWLRQHTHAVGAQGLPSNEVKGLRPGVWIRRTGMWLVLTLLPLLFVLAYPGLVASRMAPAGSLPETISIQERARSIQTALTLTASRPWSGVGAGSFSAAGHQVAPFVHTVHVAPLLLAAELGLAGGLLWLWLAAAPFILVLRQHRAQALRPYRGAAHRAQALRPYSRPPYGHESRIHARTDLRPLVAGLAPWTALLVLNLFQSHLWLTETWLAALLYAVAAASAQIEHATRIHTSAQKED